MKKLTDEQISRVLSHEAAGLLTHEVFARQDDGCGCVAGAALDLAEGELLGSLSRRAHGIPGSLFRRACEISGAVRPFVGGPSSRGCTHPYRAHGPDAVLRMLEWAGLA